MRTTLFVLIMLQSKLADWDDDDPSAMALTNSRFEKIVILKHMFTLKELEVGIYLQGCGFIILILL